MVCYLQANGPCCSGAWDLDKNLTLKCCGLSFVVPHYPHYAHILLCVNLEFYWQIVANSPRLSELGSIPCQIALTLPSWENARVVLGKQCLCQAIHTNKYAVLSLLKNNEVFTSDFIITKT